MPKQKVWIFESSFLAEENTANLENNKIETESHSWEINNFPPVTLRKKGFFGRTVDEQVYFLATSKTTPSLPSYIDMTPDKKVDSSIQKNLTNLRFLGQLVRPFRKPIKMDSFMFIIIGIVVGVVLLWVLKLVGIKLI